MAAQSINPVQMIGQFAIIIAIVYFIIVRPQQKEQAEKKKKINALKKNDRVVTAGGIHGTVVNVKETSVILRVDDSVKMEFDKEAVSIIKE